MASLNINLEKLDQSKSRNKGYLKVEIKDFIIELNEDLLANRQKTIKTSGSKNELIDRLQQALNLSSASTSQPVRTRVQSRPSNVRPTSPRPNVRPSNVRPRPNKNIGLASELPDPPNYDLRYKNIERNKKTFDLLRTELPKAYERETNRCSNLSLLKIDYEKKITNLKRGNVNRIAINKTMNEIRQVDNLIDECINNGKRLANEISLLDNLESDLDNLDKIDEVNLKMRSLSLYLP